MREITLCERAPVVTGIFRDIKPTAVNEESLELAESLIAKRSSKLDISKFEDGYEVAVKDLVEAKLKHLPVPKDEGAQPMLVDFPAV